jgi:hypothetical protein
MFLVVFIFGCVIKCMIEVKREEKAAGQDSFVSCEARQSGVLSLLPVSKGSKEWYKTNRQTELQMQGLFKAVSE